MSAWRKGSWAIGAWAGTAWAETITPTPVIPPGMWTHQITTPELIYDDDEDLLMAWFTYFMRYYAKK